MDRNTIIGFVLIFLLLMGMQYFQTQARVEAEKAKATEDSIRLAELREDSLKNQLPVLPLEETTAALVDSNKTALIDSLRSLQRNEIYGAFAPAAKGIEQEVVLENDVLKITFTNKGGRIKQVLLKKHFKMGPVEEGEVKHPLYLMDNKEDQFEYLLPVPDAKEGKVFSEDLYFEATSSANEVVFRAKIADNQYFEQKYQLSDGSYTLGYDVTFQGLEQVLQRDAKTVTLNWIDHISKVERNVEYERRLTTVYYKQPDEYATSCSLAKDDTEDFMGQPLEWVSHSNQFFNIALLAKTTAFAGGVLTIKVPGEEEKDLKVLGSSLQIPYGSGSNTFGMQFYIGPKEYDRLTAFNNEFEQTVPFGGNILGIVNRYIIRPIFGFLLGLIGSKGIVILVLTLIVKLLLFPLTYRMLYSQSKMSALKPQMEKIKEKFKDDQQQQQVETMKMYREFGVSPLGGCMPMVLQMPIWFALYRFFPAAIEFRQASFLWATDLSSFDVFTRLPFNVPFYGMHISLFTILWAISTIAYTVYNSKNIDMSAMNNNKAIIYMQYVMPVMFIFFFNNFASGLTCYLLFSSILNVLQTVVTKNFIISEEKIKQELEKNRNKPKKKNGFQSRLEEAMRQQQQIQSERTNKKQNTTPNKRLKK
ncbi:MAG: membrane protein insertase YidC [Saprospiraceae bacterium]|nr:membrane protein insertase YidC [Saprospiraceae bacterium]